MNFPSALQTKPGSWNLCLETSCYLKPALSKFVTFKGLVCRTFAHSRASGPDATWSHRAVTWHETGWTTEQGGSSDPRPSLLLGAVVRGAAACGRRLPERNHSDRNRNRARPLRDVTCDPDKGA